MKLRKKGSSMRLALITWLVVAWNLFAATSTVYVARIEGVINPANQEFIHAVIENAAEAGAECVILELDTPGGLMKSMRLIVKDILNSAIPVVVYISPPGSRAGSAGVFITYAAHIAAMAPGTNIGAAHPVAMGGADTSRTMMEKVTNDAVAFIRSLAEERGRNVEWAEKAVRESASISETEALKLHVIDVIAPTLDSLLLAINGKIIRTTTGEKKLRTQNAQIIRVEKSFRIKILEVISDPNIAYILLLIGIYGILFELYNPGLIFPGVVGAISLILAFYALHTLPVNYAGLLLIFLAIVLFLLEIKVPSFGLLTIGGIISLVLGSIMLFNSPIPFFRISWKVIVAATLGTAAFFIFAMGMALRAQRRKPQTGREGLIGEVGTAMEHFSRGRGQVQVHGEIWNATGDTSIRKGDAVIITRMDGLTIHVEPQREDKTHERQK